MSKKLENNHPKTAIVHDYFNQFGGAEKVVETWLQMYPQAVVFTSVFVPEHFARSATITAAWQQGRIRTSFLQEFFTRRQDGVTSARPTLKLFKHLFWAFPLAMSAIKIKGFANVLISSTYCAKNVRIADNPETRLIHYCHSPTRFLHGLITETDHQSLGLAYRILIPFFAWWLRLLDLRAVQYLNQRGCMWLANSAFIQQTIADVYQTKSTVVFPPIELDTFLDIQRKPDTKKPFYLCHGRISFHKRIDLAIQACLKLNRKLMISGTSGLPTEIESLQQIVTDAEESDPSKRGLISFLGRTTDPEAMDLMSHCSAFLFPGKEDFGIAPIEVLAAGVPLIAYQAGGALEYVQDGVNGIFFAEQTAESLVEAIQKYEKIETWNEKKIKQTSHRFSRSSHEDGIQDALDQQTT